MTDATIVHGTGVEIDGYGLLLRGPSGSGKSILALDLLEYWGLAGRRARLISDDRVDVSVDGAALIMRAPPGMGGLIELRGRGIISRPFVEAAPLRLIVDMVDDLVRMLEEHEFVADLLGVQTARVPVPRAGIVDGRHQRLLVNEALAQVVSGDRRQKIA